MDPNDFQLPRLLTAPAAVRVDPQIAFGKGNGFVMKGEDQQTIWWPTGYAMPPGWTGVARFDMKAWDPNLFAAVIWKGYIRLPKAGTYYFATVSTGPAAVYLGQARVALAGSYNGLLISDAFTYAKEDIQDFVQSRLYGHWDWVGSKHDAMYVVPVTIDRPRDLPFEVRHSNPRAFRPIGIDLFWVTPDSPRDASGKPVAQIVPSDAL